jgi:hypothetical protein
MLKFVSHAAQHVEEMDSAKFVKLCRDSKLLSKALTTTDIDLFFTKARRSLPDLAPSTGISY